MGDIQRQRLRHLLAAAVVDLWKKETGSLSSVLVEGTVCITSGSGKIAVLQLCDRFASTIPDDPHTDRVAHLSCSTGPYASLNAPFGYQFDSSMQFDELTASQAGNDAVTTAERSQDLTLGRDLQDSGFGNSSSSFSDASNEVKAEPLSDDDENAMDHDDDVMSSSAAPVSYVKDRDEPLRLARDNNNDAVKESCNKNTGEVIFPGMDSAAPDGNNNDCIKSLQDDAEDVTGEQKVTEVRDVIRQRLLASRGIANADMPINGHAGAGIEEALEDAEKPLLKLHTASPTFPPLPSPAAPYPAVFPGFNGFPLMPRPGAPYPLPDPALLRRLSPQGMPSPVYDENQNDTRTLPSAPYSEQSSPGSASDCTSGEQRIYRCDYCSKTFLFKSKYHEHLPVHTNARPFQCHLCTRTYKYKYDLRVHLRTHMGIPTKSTICPFCQVKFETNKRLRMHIKDVHGDRQMVTQEECTQPLDNLPPAL